jgi:hypothetical protein
VGVRDNCLARVPSCQFMQSSCLNHGAIRMFCPANGHLHPPENKPNIFEKNTGQDVGLCVLD